MNSQPPASQSHFLSVGAPVGRWSDDGGGGRGLLDGGEADVGRAVHVAGLALGAVTSTTSQLTEKEEGVELMMHCKTLQGSRGGLLGH